MVKLSAAVSGGCIVPSSTARSNHLLISVRCLGGSSRRPVWRAGYGTVRVCYTRLLYSNGVGVVGESEQKEKKEKKEKERKKGTIRVCGRGNKP